MNWLERSALWPPPARRRAARGLLLLGRQVGGDELLRAALDGRLDPPAEAGEPLEVAAALDRWCVLLAETLGVGKDPGATIERSDHSSVMRS